MSIQECKNSLNLDAKPFLPNMKER
jgi:hypothetical protein